MSNKKDSLGDRMKENYENRSKTYLTRRTPVIIRLDGKAFHTFTRGMKKPYDEIFHNTMNATMKYLCENIQGCKLGYTQSDEITLLLTDYDTLTTSAWFDYNVQKICSVSASMATMAFNKFFAYEYAGFGISMNQGESVLGTVVGIYNLHHWFSVEYYCSGVKQRTSFKPDDIGKRVQVIG